MSLLLLKNVHAVDIGFDKQCDILISDGIIKEIDDKITDICNETIDCTGLTAMPALFDMHVHFRDPGLTYKEDIVTGAAAALAGGFSGVACMPNTKPAADNAETISYIIEKAKYTGVKVYPVGCITVGLKGEELCDYRELKAAGAVAVSDDGRPVENQSMLKHGMLSADEAGLLTISHCEDLKIIGKGIINKGKISDILGVEGMDRTSEDSITEREVITASKTGCRIHIAHVSTRGSVEIIRKAKAEGVRVTCETCPHYFMMTDEKLLSRDADYRMNPPLREEEDKNAIIEGICDGTIDCIVTDHAPHSREEKADFLKAPNGIVGLETSLAAVLTGLYHTGKINLEKVVEMMSLRPRQILGLPEEKIHAGARANIVLTDLEKEWTVDPDKFKSKGRNSAFKGMKLKGKPIGTITDGKLRYFEK
ncbi:dihydroorotase [Porcipelethomonas sp.]|uniref:dihydroorotase n=1 Tax=Porcipelethomonas sp. TaxID=2981675 RepID=UPI003EF789D0